MTKEEGVVCVSPRVFARVLACVLQSAQKTHCWPAPKQHSRLFPTDKEGLVSHRETGPIYCLWLQKDWKQKPFGGREREELSECGAETFLALFNRIKAGRGDREKNLKTTVLATNDSRKSVTLNIAHLNYTLRDGGVFNLQERCITTPGPEKQRSRLG